MKKIIGILCVLALVWACSNDSETDDSVIVDPVEEVSFERSTMLVNWADNIIIPSYQAFTADMDDLLNTFNTFKADVNEGNLIALRASWLNAYKSWQHVEMFEIGPAESVGFQLNMNIYPTDNEKIDGFIVNGSYDLSLSSNRSAKGFPALDYLLNGLGDTDADILAFYSGDNKEAYLQYTEDVLMDMQSLTETVVSDWTNGYRDTFVANDGASSTASHREARCRSNGSYSPTTSDGGTWARSRGWCAPPRTSRRPPDRWPQLSPTMPPAATAGSSVCSFS